MTPQTPTEIADERIKLAYEYARLGERLAEIELEKAHKWQDIRKECKSVAEADRMWDTTELGQEEILIKSKMRTHKTKISALKTKLDVLNHESYNQY